jgi:hypothetical protein
MELSPFLSFFGLSLYRSVIATPLEGIARREILWKGFQPNSLKYLTRTGVQISSLACASWIVPSQIDVTVRGALLGIVSSTMEATVNNGWNVLVTRFVQGQGWGVIKQEGLHFLSRGLSPALMHRSLSGSIFWGTYETLHQINPQHPAITGMGAGIIQVGCTAPFYIATTLRQGQNRPPETLLFLFKNRVQHQGWIKGLFLPGLVPRCTLSLLTSGLLMTLLEKYRIIQR